MDQHYCAIKDLSKLISSQIRKHHGKKHLCDGCLQYFRIREFYNCGYLYVRIPSTEPIENKIEKLIPPNILVFKFSTTNLRSFRYLCRL
jgi:hypothetical protein